MEKIGEYSQLEEVGKGAMGVVYRAYAASVDRPVAIKVMSADLDAHPELRDRFFREARIATQLDHPNIVRIHDLAEEEGRAYIVMEFLDGEELCALINRGDAVSLERKLELMRQVAEALAYAHRNDVVHRDIKPGNIWITPEGQVKILDFGLARFKDSTLTATGVKLGTPSYMSPEQVRAAKVDHRCDIFSAGIVFYELLAGHRAFEGSRVTEIFEKIVGEEPTPLHEVNVLLPETLSMIIHTSMAKAPAHRYQSMDDLLAGLERFDRSLEKARGRVRQKARLGLRRLRELRDEHEQLLARPGHSEAPVATALPDGYLELHGVVRVAAEEYAHTEALIGELQWIAQSSAEPLAERSEKEIRRLANRVDEILDVYPGHPGAGEYGRRLLEELKHRQRESRVAALVERAHRSYEQGDADVALKLLDEALKVDPDRDEARSLRDRVVQGLEKGRHRRHRGDTRRRAQEFTSWP